MRFDHKIHESRPAMQIHDDHYLFTASELVGFLNCVLLSAPDLNRGDGQDRKILNPVAEFVLDIRQNA